MRVTHKVNTHQKTRAGHYNFLLLLMIVKPFPIRVYYFCFYI